MNERGDWIDRAGARVVTGGGHDTGINRFDHRGPISLKHDLIVLNHIRGSNYSHHLGRFHTPWEREARENARNRAEQFNLPIYEIGPLDDCNEVLKTAPDAVYIVHQCRIDFGDVTRDLDLVKTLFRGDKLERIAEHAPPKIDACE